MEEDDDDDDDRHGRVCAELHFNICRENGVKFDNKHWYMLTGKWVE